METLLNNNTRIRKKENKARRQVIEEGVVQVEALTGQRGGANGARWLAERSLLLEEEKTKIRKSV